MNKAEQNIISQQDGNQEGTPMLVGAAVKMRESKAAYGELPQGLELDPLFTPIIEAAYQLRETIKEQTKHEIEAIKRETAEQTKDLYNKLTEAGREFKILEQTLTTKSEELNSFYEEKLKLEVELEDLKALLQKQNLELQSKQEILDNIEKIRSEQIAEAESKNELLIEKLKAKIEQINSDYEQQQTNLQQQIDYQKQQLTHEITLLRDENTQINSELGVLRQEKQNWAQGFDSYHEKLQQIENENRNIQANLKEKAEKLLRTEHSLKLANQELERCQNYIKDLENKNNTMQKELFENWIQKKDEF